MRRVMVGAVIAGLAGCSDNVLVIVPLVESPVEGTDADPFLGLATIELSIAIDGEAEDLVTATFQRGQALELRDVPYGENLVIHMIGRYAGVGSGSGGESAVGRTCPFAFHPNEPPPIPRLYFARTSQWAEAPVPPTAIRIDGRAITYSDGSGLFLGGHDANGVPVSGIDRFDPMTGQLQLLATLETARLGGSIAALADGRVAVIGGVVDSLTPPTPATTVEVISVESLQHIAALTAPPQLQTNVAPALATLRNSRRDLQIVAFGGRTTDDRPIGALTTIRLDDIGDIKIDTVAPTKEPRLATPRFGHTATQLFDDPDAPWLIAGGVNDSTVVIGSAELYTPPTNRVTALALAPMLTPRRDHQAVRLPAGHVLIVGGFDALGAPVASIELFSLETGFMAVEDTLGVRAGFSLTPLPDGRVLLAGGTDMTGQPVTSASIVEFDPTQEDLVRIQGTDPLSIARGSHTATLLCDGTVMLVGGTTTASAAERYNPPSRDRR